MKNLTAHSMHKKVLAGLMILIFFVIMTGINGNYVYADVPSTVVEFNFEDQNYTADKGIPENINISKVNLYGATITATAWVVGAGGSGTFAPNSDKWNVLGDAYWQTEFSTTGYETLTLSSKQMGSNTGPRNFQVQWSLDGSNWSNVSGTAITVANNWTSGVLNNVTLPTEIKNQGKVFLRWIKLNNVSVAGGTVASGGTNRIDDIIIRGEPLTNIISYDSNGATGGSVPANQAKIFGKSLALQSNTGTLMKTGYNFVGWNTTSDGTGTAYAPGSSFSVDATTTLFAQWAKAYYTVVYEPGDYGTFAKKTDSGLSYDDPTPSAPTVTGQDGFIFIGWSPELTNTVTGDVTYTALWSQEGPVVFYHIYGGGGNINGVYQNDFVVLKNISDKPVDLSGWTIQYASSQGTTWYTSNPLNGKICPGDFYVVRAWLGNNNPSQPELPYFHEDLPQLAIHMKEFKMSLRDKENIEIDFIGTGNADEFLGGGAAPATADSGNHRNQESIIRNMAQENPFSGNNNLDYKVQWPTDLSYLAGQTYTVFFDNNSGDPEAIPRQITSTHGDSINPLPEQPPQRLGYTFSGWNTKANGTGTAFDQETKVTACLTVYAQYTRNAYSVEFKVGDHGTFNPVGQPATQQVLYEGSAAAPTVVTDPGYTFTGWDKTFDSITEDMVITAQYELNTYTVLFSIGEGANFNVGGGTQQQNVLFGSQAAKPEPPSRSGYTFAGWYADGNLTVEYVFSGAVQKDLILYAKWTKNASQQFPLPGDDSKQQFPLTGDEPNLPALAFLCALGLLGMGLQYRHLRKS
jgi:uncharacterized repeat protein (TIGR02543 family)